MDSPKYLISLTLIEGQKFSVPDGINDKVEATVFAEARFGNESVLKSDPIRLFNSNPEFVTELAWQLDKKSLHQLRVERRAIKLQIFMQTREKKKKANIRQINGQSNGDESPRNNNAVAANKIELVGYTVIDIRSAQEISDDVPPKFQWVSLLNPRFRKSSDSRPELQIAVTLNRIERDADNSSPNSITSNHQSHKSNVRLDISNQSDAMLRHDAIETESTLDSRLYQTCLDTTIDPAKDEYDKVLDNDLKIIYKEGKFFIYDTHDATKSNIDDCDEKYRIIVTIPFSSDLDILVGELRGQWYYSVDLFGTTLRTEHFDELNNVQPKSLQFDICATDLRVLTIYFELNSSLDIKLHDSETNEIHGITTVQLDQLCGNETRSRSIEGIFIMSNLDGDFRELSSRLFPTIGVSVIIERVEDASQKGQEPNMNESIGTITLEYNSTDLDNSLSREINGTHQLTTKNSSSDSVEDEATVKPCDEEVRLNDHHFCFTIDLKSFSYSQGQPMFSSMRELMVRYSYPFFGYQDTISTDSSIKISPTSSIIVSGFCEFNFATSYQLLLSALKNIPLSFDIMTCDQLIQVAEPSDTEALGKTVATCSLNLANVLNLTENSLENLQNGSMSTTTSESIHNLCGEEIGRLQIYLCLKDLGQPSYNFRASADNLASTENPRKPPIIESHQESQKFGPFMAEIKRDFDLWKDDNIRKISDDIRKKENERYKRLLQRFEAKDTSREQEFKRKLDEVTNLERQFRKSLSNVESLENKLFSYLEELKTKDAILDNRFDLLDSTISKAISDIKLEFERRLNSLPMDSSGSLDVNTARPLASRAPPKSKSEIDQTRRSSLKTASNSSPRIPVPVRSSSLVRSSAVDSATVRLVKRPTGMITTVVNGYLPRARSNSTKVALSKENQEKLASLRREKADLLKRGCRPSDEIIQEINSLIEKLAF